MVVNILASELLKLSSRSETTKGASSFGKGCHKPHIRCHYCASKAQHLRKSTCRKCGYPAKHKRKCNWSVKAKRCMKYHQAMRLLKIRHCRFRHGFYEGTIPKPKRAAVVASRSS
ncbi:60S ribosomal protein L37-like [Fukomys damarensis]|uniref:60S ribosomal protein L37-like n=1 Tax=Fukomys damarensis TaxID=885580 RepID=UPI0014555432|nr:60S ribosomal protein L37-like [Fukomys damarensis]